MSDLTVAIRQVVAARHPEDLFPVDAAAPAEDKAEQLKRSYRRLVRVVHPDANGNTPGAAAAFVKLERLYTQAQATLGVGTYGDRAAAPRIVRGTRLSFVLGRQLASNAVEVFEAFAAGTSYTLKVASDPANNDLLEREAAAVQKLRADDAVEQRLAPYVPDLVDSFTITSDKGAVAVNAFPSLEGFVSVREVRAAYPGGIHWRDMAWMFRRILVAAGYAHANGLVHGAVVPDNVWIHPTDHGLVLSDWMYATPAGESLVAVPSRRRSWYPAITLTERLARPELDVLFAVRCAQYLLGADRTWLPAATTPTRLRAFLAGCASSPMPDDAWALLEEFDELIGPREYRPFRMPSQTTDTPSSGGPSAAQPSEGR